MKYFVDPLRCKKPPVRTGILVIGEFPDGKRDPVDISQLMLESLLKWLRSRGGENWLAEATVATLVGHDLGASGPAKMRYTEEELASKEDG